MKRKLYSGVRIGRLVLINVVAHKEIGIVRKVKVEIWKCLCDCGNYVEYAANSLSCRARSCGCLNYENIHRKNKYRILPEGYSFKSPEYISIRNALIRCKRPQQEKDKKNYADRGIDICERWDIEKTKYAYANFINDMGKRPEGYMLDRIDNNKGYSPENCRWTTKSQSNKNRRPFKRGKK